jgi:hypothetical protein
VRALPKLTAPAAMIACCLLGGCGSSSGGAVNVPHVAPARQFVLAGFQPSSAVSAGRPTTISFTVRTPDGKALTSYRTGSGPHTGVHLIIVRDDLAYIIHEHPPVGPGGVVRQTVTFPAPGPYKVLADLYPNIPGGQPNFQLFQTLHVSGPYKPKPLPQFRSSQLVAGLHIDMQGHPRLHAIQAQFITVNVLDSSGNKVNFVPWFGALAHAIFFHRGSLDYFHTHVCGAGATNCASVLGGSTVTGRSTTPGRLTLGVLLPVPGTWRLFLQMKVGGRVVTAPYTLNVT